jgi:hypothetical protein
MTDTTHSTNDDAKLLALWDEWKGVMRLHEAIRVAPARGVDGVSVKLALTLWYYGKDEADIIVEQLRATYDDTTRLTGQDYLAEINAIVEQRAT